VDGVVMRLFPSEIPNLIAGKEKRAKTFFEKRNPHDGRTLSKVSRSGETEIEAAVSAASAAQRLWAEVPAPRRGEILFRFADLLKTQKDKISRIAALETGKSLKNAYGETDGSAALGLFFAGEGQRLYGRTTTSAVAGRTVATVREPVGVAGLIVSANTPVPNLAWKVFPALICGNAVVLKAAEDAPATAWFFGRLASEAGLPDGLLNVVQGLGEEAGEALVRHPDVALISFTGSTAVGRRIGALGGERLAKVSLELGGKNPFIVCEDADLDQALHWAILSAFSNAGQRCASASRIIVFDKIYAKFRALLLTRTRKLKLGVSDADDFGPVVNEDQLSHLLEAVTAARKRGAKVIAGGKRLMDAAHRKGYYLAPTLLEGVRRSDPLSREELFGPVAVLYRAKHLREALEIANDSPYGLTAAIHTRSLERAFFFTKQILAGVACVNAGTFGSEPHLPFGGVKASGNGTREPGTEALEVYSNLKNIYLNAEFTG